MCIVMNCKDAYLEADPERITEFLADFYRNSPEGDYINRLMMLGKSVVELPADFEPMHLSGKADVEGWEKKLTGFDHVILYHGSSTVYQDDISNNGLEPRSITGNGNFVGGLESQDDSVYLGQLNYFGNWFDSVKNHAYNVAKKKGGFPLIVRAIVPLNDCLSDEDVKRANNGLQSLVFGGTARIRGTISPDSLFLYPQSAEVLEDRYNTSINEFNFYEFLKNQSTQLAN